MECFYNKLLGEVSNNTLPVFGKLSLNVKSAATADNQIILSTTSLITFIAEGNGYFALTKAGLDDESLRLKSLDINVSDGDVTLYLKNDTYTCGILNKYALKKMELASSPNDMYLNINQFEGCTDLEYLKLRDSAGCTGDISVFGNLTNLTTLDLRSAGNEISGDITALSTLNNLITLELERLTGITGELSDLMNALPAINRITAFRSYGTSCDIDEIANTTFTMASPNMDDSEGSIEGFVASQIANGRTSADTDHAVNIYRVLDFATFGGNKQSTGSTDKTHTFITWTSASHIVVYPYNITSKHQIFCLGASQEEIAAWNAAGRTVTDVSTGTVYPSTNS